MSTYPEHDKMQALGERRDEVQEFLDWLLDQPAYELAEWLTKREDGTEYFFPRLVPVNKSREQIMADYFGIDLQKLSEEKDAMLADFRAAAVSHE